MIRPSAIVCDGGTASLCSLVQQVTGSAEAGRWMAWTLDVPLRLLFLLLLALVSRRVLLALISRLSERIAEGPKNVDGLPERLTRGVLAAPPQRRAQRAQTVASVLRSVTSAAIFSLFALMLLTELGFPVGPLLASAGVVGVALGFGAQSVVKDVVTGIFMIIEDQFGVGDVVDVGAASGTIEAVGLRVTRLRDVEGTVWYVRNGEVLRVGNHSQGWSRVVLDVGIDPSEDVSDAEQRLLALAAGLRDDAELGDYVIGTPEVWGITALTAEAVVLRLVVRTHPTRQTAVAAALRGLIKQAFTTPVFTTDGTLAPATSPD